MLKAIKTRTIYLITRRRHALITFPTTTTREKKRIYKRHRTFFRLFKLPNNNSMTNIETLKLLFILLYFG